MILRPVPFVMFVPLLPMTRLFVTVYTLLPE